MATYVPNPTDSSQPTEDKFVESAAAEFRALKAYTRDSFSDVDADIAEIEADIDAIQDEIAGLQNATELTSNAVADLFSGDGTTTHFTLSVYPGRQANLKVSISAAVQRPGVDFTWDGNVGLNFSTAPIAGVQNILVQYSDALPPGSTGDLRGDLSDPDSVLQGDALVAVVQPFVGIAASKRTQHDKNAEVVSIFDCLLYTSDAADD